jgi:hypothetical protein
MCRQRNAEKKKPPCGGFFFDSGGDGVRRLSYEIFRYFGFTHAFTHAPEAQPLRQSFTLTQWVFVVSRAAAGRGHALHRRTF